MGRAGPPHAAAADAQTAVRAPGCRRQAAAPGGCRRAPRGAAPPRSRPARSLRRALLSASSPYPDPNPSPPAPLHGDAAAAAASDAARLCAARGRAGAGRGSARRAHPGCRPPACAPAGCPAGGCARRPSRGTAPTARGAPRCPVRHVQGGRALGMRPHAAGSGPCLTVTCMLAHSNENQSVHVQACRVNTEAAERDREPRAKALWPGQDHRTRCCLLLRPSQYIQTAGEVPQTALK